MSKDFLYSDLKEQEVLELVGVNMRKLRKERGWTLEDVEATGEWKNWQHWQKLEQGKKSMTLITFLKVCKVLEVTPEELLKQHG